MTWFQMWTICWQITIVLTPILLGAVVLWLNSRFVSKTDAKIESNRIDADLKQQFGKLSTALEQANAVRDARWDSVRDSIADHGGRLNAVEKDIAKPPSRHALNNAITALQGGVHSLGKSLDSLRDRVEAQGDDTRRQIETQNQYLRALIEKHLA